ncbi:hypothetical protein V1523DRAFT_399300 [Lipomyces doorenjongii]
MSNPADPSNQLGANVHQALTRDSWFIGTPPLGPTWSLVMEFVAAGHAYAHIKAGQIEEGWLPLMVDYDALGLAAISAAKFTSWVDLAVGVQTTPELEGAGAPEYDEVLSPTQIIVVEPEIHGPLVRAVRDGNVRLDEEGRVVVAPGTLTCPLCAVVGIRERVYNETTMVRSHLRTMHKVPVPPEPARMGRPGLRLVVAESAVQKQQKRRVRRLTRQYKLNRVSAETVRWRLRELLSSGLSMASKAETVVHALEGVSAVYPGFDEELRSARTYLEPDDTAEVGFVELSWPMVQEFVAATRAFAEIKAEQVSVDYVALAPHAITVSEFAVCSSQAMTLCTRGRVLERLVARPAGAVGSLAVPLQPMLHFDVT